MNSPEPHPPKVTTETAGRGRLSVYLFISSGVAIAIIGALAMLTHEPLVFPSLGPSAYMLFGAPLAAASSPRNVFCGHLIGVAAGVIALALFGLLSTPPDLENVTPARLGAVTLCVALTLAAMTWFGVAHAPAAATTLIVGLGLLRGPLDWSLMMAAVASLVIIAGIINRIHGVQPPVWAPASSCE